VQQSVSATMRTSLRLTLAIVAFDVARGSTDVDNDEWVSFPSAHGAVLIHRDCIHRLNDNFHVEGSKDGGDFLSYGQDRSYLSPCPHAPHWPNSSSNEAALQAKDARYYSDWAAYAQTTGDLGYMSSDWVVPAAPKSTGPIPGMSSVYFFNGLEDGNGVHGKSTYILQPVLSYGKSGCIIDPLNFFQWHLISFSVSGAGRAYCGKRISVKEGESVRGIMRLENDGHTWTTLSVRLSNNETSAASSDLKGKQPNSAYVALESMINYSCKAFPASGSLTFTANVLRDRSGNSISPSWTKMLRHTECNEKVQVSSDGTITISWNSGKSYPIQV